MYRAPSSKWRARKPAPRNVQERRILFQQRSDVVGPARGIASEQAAQYYTKSSFVAVALLRPKSRGRIFSVSKEDPILTYQFNQDDLPLLKNACRKLVRLLFVAGADTVYLPIAGEGPLSKEQELEAILSKAKPSDFEIISVHVMGACPLGDSRSIVDQHARIKSISNAIVCDASILPTNIGESPQGTIMAFAHEVMQRHLDSTNQARPRSC